jgi:ABC-2 type transport system ATP-binding protein
VTVDATAPLARDAAALARDSGDLLVLHGIRKSWGKRSVLEGVDLSVARGALVSIGGANGTGKTTLLRIAAGLIHAHSGSVTLDGLHPERDRRAYLARLGFLSAGDRGLYARLSARRHLDLWARLALVPPRGRKAAVEQAISIFALDDYADRRVDRLSMGQRQRVGLAMTFVHNPNLILLDEPANSLDREGLEVLTRYLELVRSRGGSAVWCAPDGSGTPLASDTKLRLVEGRLWRA